MAPIEGDSDRDLNAARLEWLDWDGSSLRWRIHSTRPIATQLRIDGVAFQRFAETHGAADFACAFDYSPTGNAELAFTVSADDASTGAAWRVLHGVAARRGVDQWARQPHYLAALAGTPQLPERALTQLPAVAVVIPIYNAADSLHRCLAALERWSPPSVSWILVDDASTDPAIAPLLAHCLQRGNVQVERHSANRGYTRAVNTGIAAAGNADVVLLNSDTEVGPRWLESLRLAAYGDDAIGTVTAVSDNAGAFSVPELEQYCPTPSRWDLTAAQRAVLQQAGLRFPELPTGNGFCMLVKREVIAHIGVMDADAFPAGYGEENDFCQRAIQAGYRNIIAGNVLVRHERSASFGDARRVALGVHGMAVLRQRYPRYEADVGATLYSFARRVLDYRVRRTYGGGDGYYERHTPRPRVLIAGAAAIGAEPVLASRGYEVFTLGDRPSLHLYRSTADGAGADVAASEAPAHGESAAQIRVWLVAFAIEQVLAPPDDAFAATVGALAAGLGIPVSINPTRPGSAA